jgi:hypothetical protein
MGSINQTKLNERNKHEAAAATNEFAPSETIPRQDALKDLRRTWTK